MGCCITSEGHPTQKEEAETEREGDTLYMVYCSEGHPGWIEMQTTPVIEALDLGP